MKHSSRTIPRLFQQWKQVAARIQSSRHIALILDFDGTLVPIAPHPCMVTLAPELRRILRRLARHPRVSVAIISGRRRNELVRLISIRGIHYFGLYGRENGEQKPISPSEQESLKIFHKALTAVLCDLPSVWIESKRGSLSIHLMAVRPALARSLRNRIRATLLPFRHTLQLFENLRDMEILPRSNPGKGVTVCHFLGKLRLRGPLPIYFGDDLSDEPAFAALCDGVSVLVGRPRITRAQFRLQSPAHIASALQKLEDTLA